jgi:hypothetical protein
MPVFLKYTHNPRDAALKGQVKRYSGGPGIYIIAFS